MSQLSEEIIGNVDFETFADLVEERVREIDTENTYAENVVHQHSDDDHPDVKIAQMRLARLRIETVALLRTLDIAGAVFRIITKLDHLVGERCDASRKLLLRLFEDTRTSGGREILSLTQLDSIEKYFDFTVGHFKRLQRSLSDEEKGWIQTSIIAMVK